MAIYHLTIKNTNRSEGKNAIARAAYRSGDKLTYDKTGETFDYGKKRGIEYSELIFGSGWNKNITREIFWNMAEDAEKRKDSVVCREFEIALPLELNEQQRIDLARKFTRALVNRFGFAADLAIHNPNSKNRKPRANLNYENPHAHILTTTRNADGKKIRELDQAKKSGVVREIRILWSKYCNYALKEAGSDSRISEKSILQERNENGRKHKEFYLRKFQEKEDIDKQLAAIDSELADIDKKISLYSGTGSYYQRDSRSTNFGFCDGIRSRTGKNDIRNTGRDIEIRKRNNNEIKRINETYSKYNEPGDRDTARQTIIRSYRTNEEFRENSCATHTSDFTDAADALIAELKQLQVQQTIKVINEDIKNDESRQQIVTEFK